MAGDSNADIPESGAVFTFGRSRFANNAASHFFIRNDPVVEMSCGDEHTAVVCQNGRVFAFGNNSWGQLGLGHKDTATMPSCVKSLKPEKATHVACGKSHTIVSTLSGKVFAFGSNMDCQLGVGDTEERVSPVEVVGLFAGEDGVRMVTAGCQHSAVLTVDGSVYVWGSNADGQLGLGDSVSVVDTPQRIEIPHTIAFISCGYYHTALVTEDGKLLMCGEGENGKLGLSRENNNIFVPTPVNINVPIRSVACGGNHTIAVTMDGDVYGFGSNLSGQLGLGREVLSFSVPECIETLLGKHVCAAACGEIHSTFLTVEGHMYACGDGRHGKLCVEIDGDEGIVQCTPQLVSRFSQYRVKQVACGGCHTMVHAILEVDASKSDSIPHVNGDVSLRLQKPLSRDNDMTTAATADGQNRVLPPLQNAPVLNGFTEKSSKKETDDKKTFASDTENENVGPTSTTIGKDLHVGEPDDGEILSNQSTQEIEQTVENDKVTTNEDGHINDVNNMNGDSSNSHKTSDQESTESSAGHGTINHTGSNDLYSKFNLRDASDLTNGLHDATNGKVAAETTENPDTPRTVEAENGDAYPQMIEERRCSVDVTPTLTVTGTDGVDLDNEEMNVTGDDKTVSKPNIMDVIEKGEGKMTKFFNAFRRKKLSEENMSVNTAWTDDSKKMPSENNLKNGRSTQSQIIPGQVHRSKACTIL